MTVDLGAIFSISSAQFKTERQIAVYLGADTWITHDGTIVSNPYFTRELEKRSDHWSEIVPIKIDAYPGFIVKMIE